MNAPTETVARPGLDADKPPMWKAYAASSIGIEMALYVIIGYFAGGWVDSKLGTPPLFMMLLVIVGVAFGIFVMIRASRAAWGIKSADAASKGQR